MGVVKWDFSDLFKHLPYIHLFFIAALFAASFSIISMLSNNWRLTASLWESSLRSEV
jgi:hypothetical protein